MNYLEQVIENYSYFNDTRGGQPFTEQLVGNYSFANATIEQVTTPGLYEEILTENYSYSNQTVGGLVVKIQQDFNYSTSFVASAAKKDTLSENFNYSDSVQVGKLISITIDDTYNYSNEVATIGDYLAKIAENYNVKTTVNAYKLVNGEIVLDETLDCWVVNFETNAFSRYSNYRFDSFTKFNDEYYGVNELGLFKLSGTTDNELEIKAKLLTGKIDVSGIGSSSYVRDIFLYHKSDGTLRLNVYANDGKKESYRLLNASEDIMSSKIVLSKGRKAIYWQFELTNDEQTDFELEQMKVYRLITGKIT